ncbi:MAG: hypothetical protein JWQ76_4943 [Ramlibacter sp.]|nr:hypothetical protein [Ramlibacter sp.]
MTRPVTGALLKAILCVAVAACLSACSTMRHGGAPNPVYAVDTDLAVLTETFKTMGSVGELYNGTPSDTKRNAFLDARVAMANLAYIQFVSDLTADKQQLDTAAEMLVLGLNLLGTTVTGIRASSNLAAAAAGIGGSKAIVDKNYYYEKTTTALITMMNARRKEVLARIVEGTKKPLSAYGYTQALSDSHDYYAAGTLQSAIAAVQSEASAKELRADAELAMVGELPVLTDSEIADRRSATEAVLRVLKAGDLARLQAALRLLGLGGLPQATVEEARASLRGNFRTALRNNPELAVQVKNGL